jgi:hypothetical protein
MTNRSRPLQVALATALAVLAVVGYVVFVKQTHVDVHRVSALVIRHPGTRPGLLKAAAPRAQLVPTSSSTYATVKKLGLRDPDETASFARTWQGVGATHRAATVLVDLLPDETAAATTRAEAAKLDLGATSFASAGFVRTSRFSVPGVAGSEGSVYAVPASATNPAGTAYTLVYRVGRVVVSMLAETGPGGLTRSDAEAIARAEHDLVARVEPGFSLAVTTRQLWVSVVYIVVAAAVVLLALALPGLVRRQRRVHQERAAVRARYQYRARGRKTVRRHRTPDWSRPRR